jgi:Stage III sporulation protein AC/AD protein family.
MEQTIQITAACVTGALLALLLKRQIPETALLVTLAAAAAAFLFLSGAVEQVLNFLDRLSREAGVSQELFIPLYKTVGIALVVRIGGNLCRDAGESALAAVVETAGAICALVTALPLLSAVLELLVELMQS